MRRVFTLGTNRWALMACSTGASVLLASPALASGDADHHRHTVVVEDLSESAEREMQKKENAESFKRFFR